MIQCGPTYCPICGTLQLGPAQPNRYNGTCSPDCARTKANVDAFTSLGDLIRALVPPQPPLPANLRDRTPYYV